jgi:superfamily II RNA helicase
MKKQGKIMYHHHHHHHHEAIAFWSACILLINLLVCTTASFVPSISSATTLFPSVRHNTSEPSSSNKRHLLSLSSQSDTNGFDIQHHFNFPLDDWQLQAGTEIIKGNNVITCAATGAGKTVVGEIGLHYAFANNKDAIYTTPLKALSNQKFMELRKIFGAENVGLSTGDMSINRGAQIMVMTTEVYRNMAWRASSSPTTADASDDMTEDDEVISEDNDLANLAVVVLDEFHYMGQPGRGGVWEECVITSPAHTQIVGLSATLPNAHDISSWMSSVTKQTTLVEASGGRPVPLRYMFATRDGLEYLFKDEDAGPGAPNGLLGLRGDGVAPISKKDQTSNVTPKGLSLNPKLKATIQRRAQKINRMIAKKSIQSEFNRKDNFRDRSGRNNESGNNKRKKMSAREEKRERDRLLKSEMRKSVPSLHFLLRKLNQRSLLPAIFFIFSRAGCDTAAEQICQNMRKEEKVFDNKGEITRRNSRQRGDSERRQRNKSEEKAILEDNNGRRFRPNSNYISEDSMSSILDSADSMSQEELMKELNPLEAQNFEGYANRGFLTCQQVREVAARAKSFNSDNEEIKFSDNVIDQMLHGVGSHHAGQLPAHKAFVEALFRAQLMKAVFATETLAAGINMPARTTVICSMAKRGAGSSMNLLETSNMLQMAGRAGRRGMDTDGTCVITATPFEGPTEAIDIVTSEIKPVKSQFTPSYSLAVNLIARGNGNLDVAQKLVRKSFAMWGKEQAESRIESIKNVHGDQFDEVIEIAAHLQFLEVLQRCIEERYGANGSNNRKVQRVLEVLENKTLLKKASKSFSGLNQILELEQNTVNYLQQEADSMKSIDNEIDEDGLLALMNEEDRDNVQNEIDAQNNRIEEIQVEMSKHVMSAMTIFANDALTSLQDGASDLQSALSVSRIDAQTTESLVSPLELCKFSKSAVMTNRKRRKQTSKSKEEGFGDSALIAQLNESEVGDDAWEDMLSLLNVLQSFGCIVASHDSDDVTKQTFKITIAGENVAGLGFDNSLWLLVAMGGAWDVKGDSSKIDEFKMAMDSFQSFDIEEEEEGNDSNDSVLQAQADLPSNESDNIKSSLAQSEVAALVDLLRSLDPSEMAGYVSCLVVDGFRGNNNSALSYFQNISPIQQRVIQSSLNSLERLVEVQNKYTIDDSTNKVQLELGPCEVVTAWAAGCSWNEALELSGLAAGDLVRILHRALDALRQLGNLSMNAARSLDTDLIQKESTGLHPDIRRLCRDAANAMDRYPVKDPLPFDDENENSEEEETEEGEEEDTVDVTNNLE